VGAVPLPGLRLSKEAAPKVAEQAAAKSTAARRDRP